MIDKQTQADRKGDWMTTFTGGHFYPFDPRAGEICIEDIAHHLSLTCRFGGSCREFYSVAQHSILVSMIVPAEFALWGLLHDAAEAYIGDMPRPIKRQQEMYAYREAEERIMRCVCERFGLPVEMPPCVKTADEVLLATEARDIATHRCHIRSWRKAELPMDKAIVCWTPKDAEWSFLDLFALLTKGHEGVVPVQRQKVGR